MKPKSSSISSHSEQHAGLGGACEWAPRVPRAEDVAGSDGTLGCLNVLRAVRHVLTDEKPVEGDSAHIHSRPLPVHSGRKISQPPVATNPQGAIGTVQEHIPRITVQGEKKT